MIEEIRSQTRKAYVILKRQALCYYLFDFKNYDVYEIANFIKRDRTTVIYSIKTFKEKLKTDIKCIEELTELKKQNFDLDKYLIDKFMKQNKTRLSSKLKKYLENYE